MQCFGNLPLGQLIHIIEDHGFPMQVTEAGDFFVEPLQLLFFLGFICPVFGKIRGHQAFHQGLQLLLFAQLLAYE